MIICNTILLILIGLTLLFPKLLTDLALQSLDSIRELIRKPFFDFKLCIKIFLFIFLNTFLQYKAYSYFELNNFLTIVLFVISNSFIIIRYSFERKFSRKEKVIQEFTNLINLICEKLEQSSSIDKAIRGAFEEAKLIVLKREIENFLSTHNYSIQIEIVDFLINLSSKYKIKEFTDYLQILSLEIKYDQSSCKIFHEISSFIHKKEEATKKFHNNYKLIKFGIDFMLAYFYLNLLLLTPKLSLSSSEWLKSNNKDLEIFFSSIVFWVCYLITQIYLQEKKRELI